MTGDAAGRDRGSGHGTKFDRLLANAKPASDFLKALSNENRLQLLCLLAEGEKSVGELEKRLGLRQPAVSQQLARLRADDLVGYRRSGKAIYYSLASEPVRQVISLLHDIFCRPPVQDRVSQGAKPAADAPLT